MHAIDIGYTKRAHSLFMSIEISGIICSRFMRMFATFSLETIGHMFEMDKIANIKSTRMRTIRL